MKPNHPPRARHDQRGSILIFVIGVLVLLAVSATAYLSTARTDRVTTKQNEFNTQVDILLQGLEQVTVARTLQDETIADDFRAPTEAAGGGTFDTDSGLNDPWLGSRIPEQFLGTGTPRVVWRYLTAQLFRVPPTGTAEFETPRGDTYDNRLNAAPFFDAADPDRSKLQFLDPAGTVLDTVDGADADGDGIADAGYFKLPITSLNGITYYGAVRIIDHNSAANANSALSRSDDYDASFATNFNPLPHTGFFAAPTGMFTGSVGLRELLNGNTAAVDTELRRILTARLGTTTTNDVATVANMAMGTYEYRSIGDKFFHELGRRINDPFESPGEQYQPFTLSDQISLTNRFIVRDPQASPSRLETAMNITLQTGAPAKPYAPNQLGMWFMTQFDFGVESGGISSLPKRSIITAVNPVSPLVRGPDLLELRNFPATDDHALVVRYNNAAEIASIGLGERMEYYHPTNGPTSGAQPFTTMPTRASINQADFNELWRAFYLVMCSPGNTTTAEVNPTVATAADMGIMPFFRSPIFRGLVTTNEPDRPVTRMLMRSAQAAVNAIDMRDFDVDTTTTPYDPNIPESITVKQVRLNGLATPFNAYVFGTERQPFITQVIVAEGVPTDPAIPESRPVEYVGVELYNPYSTPLRMRLNWRLGWFDRNATPKTITPAADLDDLIIPARGFLTIESNSAARPVGLVALGTGTNVTVAPDDVRLLNAKPAVGTEKLELVLLRPRSSSGRLNVVNDVVTATGDDPATLDTIEPTEVVTLTALENLVPLDQVVMDYAPHANAAEPAIYAKRRPTSLVYPFKCVMQYPTTSLYAPSLVKPWDLLAPTYTPPPNQPVVFTLGLESGDLDLIPTDYPTIQLANLNWPSPTAIVNGAPKFPYWGFARNGDIYQVPFIGGVMITDVTTGDLVELTSISIDAFNARDNVDTTFADQHLEPVGRFFPDPDRLSTPPPPDAGIDGYSWARDLFSYLTVIDSPTLQYEQNVPRAGDAMAKEANATVAPATDFNSTGTIPVTGNVVIRSGGTQGLININTAPARILATLPWVPSNAANVYDEFTYNAAAKSFTAGSNGVSDNVDIANVIVAWRDAPAAPRHFASIADLMTIPEFRLLNNEFTQSMNIGTTRPDPNDPDDIQGDVTPVNDPAGTANPDDVRDDFEERSLILSRVSNLLTTRSDVFTAYILLEGYRNGGTNNAELVVRRRSALIIDRSTVNADNSAPAVTPVRGN